MLARLDEEVEPRRIHKGPQEDDDDIQKNLPYTVHKDLRSLFADFLPNSLKQLRLPLPVAAEMQVAEKRLQSGGAAVF